jgi:hypothetical protein
VTVGLAADLMGMAVDVDVQLFVEKDAAVFHGKNIIGETPPEKELMGD